MFRLLHGTFRVSFALTILAVSVFAYSDVETDVEEQMKRVTLDPVVAFPDLPKPVIAALKSLNCKVPQVFKTEKPQNVIRGSFAAKGQMDWAALCSIHGVSRIEMFWGGSTRCPSELEPIADRVYLEVTDKAVNYGRAIQPLERKYIEAFNSKNDRPIPPPVSHDGIDDELVGTSSVVHYCRAGQWLKLPGSD